jgi:hypothetical protein
LILNQGSIVNANFVDVPRAGATAARETQPLNKAGRIPHDCESEHAEIAQQESMLHSIQRKR